MSLSAPVSDSFRAVAARLSRGLPDNRAGYRIEIDFDALAGAIATINFIAIASRLLENGNIVSKIGDPLPHLGFRHPGFFWRGRTFNIRARRHDCGSRQNNTDYETHGNVPWQDQPVFFGIALPCAR
jgi:hypothetical protein